MLVALRAGEGAGRRLSRRAGAKVRTVASKADVPLLCHTLLSGGGSDTADGAMPLAWSVRGACLFAWRRGRAADLPGHCGFGWA